MVPSPLEKKALILSDLIITKKNLRKEYRRRRDAFVSQLDDATRNLVFRRPPSPVARLLESADVVAVYASQASEAPTGRLIEYLAELQKTIAFPVVMGATALDFRTVSNVELLESGFMGISEPGGDCPLVEPDIIITPIIAFNRSLDRLGQGGGHYDRTFEKHPNARRIGLAWSVQETQDLMPEQHDIGLHAIVTESEYIQKVDMTS